MEILNCNGGFVQERLFEGQEASVSHECALQVVIRVIEDLNSIFLGSWWILRDRGFPDWASEKMTYSQSQQNSNFHRRCCLRLIEVCETAVAHRSSISFSIIAPGYSQPPERCTRLDIAPLHIGYRTGIVTSNTEGDNNMIQPLHFPVPCEPAIPRLVGIKSRDYVLACWII